MATTYVKDIEDMFKDYARNIIKSISVKHKINYDETIAEEPSFFDINASGIFTFEQFAKFIDYMKSLTQ